MAYQREKGRDLVQSDDESPNTYRNFINIVAAFRGMHVSPAKHSNV